MVAWPPPGRQGLRRGSSLSGQCEREPSRAPSAIGSSARRGFQGTVTMAEDSGSGAGMGLIVGALLVVVLIIAAVVFFGGGSMFGGGTKKLDVNISAPNL